MAPRALVAPGGTQRHCWDRPPLLRVADLLGLARAAQLAGPGVSMEWGRTWGRLGCDLESVARRGHLPG